MSKSNVVSSDQDYILEYWDHFELANILIYLVGILTIFSLTIIIINYGIHSRSTCTLNEFSVWFLQKWQYFQIVFNRVIVSKQGSGLLDSSMMQVCFIPGNAKFKLFIRIHRVAFGLPVCDRCTILVTLIQRTWTRKKADENTAACLLTQTANLPRLKAMSLAHLDMLTFDQYNLCHRMSSVKKPAYSIHSR